MSEILRNIREQPNALATIAEYLQGDGREKLKNAAALIRDHSRVVFVAIGGSQYAALPGALYLSQRGLDARVLCASEVLYYNLVPPDAAVVLVSRSGRTAEMVRIAERLKVAGTPYISVTNSLDSPMSAGARIAVHVEGRSDEGVSIRSYTGTLLTLLYLCAECVNTTDSFHSEVISMLNLLASEMSGWEATAASIDDARLFCFLGRGYSLSCACEASLLFMELARRPASWYISAEFRQGPVEVLQPKDAVFVFAPDCSTHHLSAALADELKITGAKVTTIGPPWPRLPEYLAAITQIIPVQFAAYYLALRHGDEPGHFRFAASITEYERGLSSTAS